jgi:hypothetical protein
VARDVSWLVTTELLQLPCAPPRRTSTEDALADAILSDPRVTVRIWIGDVLPAEGRAHRDGDFRLCRNAGGDSGEMPTRRVSS